MSQQFLLVEPPAGNTLLPLILLSPAHVQRVEADKGDIENVEVGVVANDRTIVGNGHLGDDMVCLIGALNYLKSKKGKITEPDIQIITSTPSSTKTSWNTSRPKRGKT